MLTVMIEIANSEVPIDTLDGDGGILDDNNGIPTVFSGDTLVSMEPIMRTPCIMNSL